MTPQAPAAPPARAGPHVGPPLRHRPVWQAGHDAAPPPAGPRLVTAHRGPARAPPHPVRGLKPPPRAAGACGGWGAAGLPVENSGRYVLGCRVRFRASFEGGATLILLETSVGSDTVRPRIYCIGHPRPAEKNRASRRGSPAARAMRAPAKAGQRRRQITHKAARAGSARRGLATRAASALSLAAFGGGPTPACAPFRALSDRPLDWHTVSVT